jgi:hypothetical protein
VSKYVKTQERSDAERGVRNGLRGGSEGLVHACPDAWRQEGFKEADPAVIERWNGATLA